MTNWIVIAIVIVIGILFILPALSGLKKEGSGGTIGGGAETIPSGDVGQGGILPEENVGLNYVPGTGTNTSVAPFEPSQKILDAMNNYYSTSSPAITQESTRATTIFNQQYPSFSRNLTPDYNTGKLLFGTPQGQNQTAQQRFTAMVSPSQQNFNESKFPTLGSGKSNTQNLAAPIIPTSKPSSGSGGGGGGTGSASTRSSYTSLPSISSVMSKAGVSRPNLSSYSSSSKSGASGR